MIELPIRPSHNVMLKLKIRKADAREAKQAGLDTCWPDYQTDGPSA